VFRDSEGSTGSLGYQCTNFSTPVFFLGDPITAAPLTEGCIISGFSVRTRGASALDRVPRVIKRQAGFPSRYLLFPDADQIVTNTNLLPILPVFSIRIPVGLGVTTDWQSLFYRTRRRPTISYHPTFQPDDVPVQTDLIYDRRVHG